MAGLDGLIAAGGTAPRRVEHAALERRQRRSWKLEAALLHRRHQPHRPGLGTAPPRADQPAMAPMVRDDEIERIAVAVVTFATEEARGWVVESVEAENRGFDLIARSRTPKTRRPSSRFGSSR